MALIGSVLGLISLFFLRTASVGLLWKIAIINMRISIDQFDILRCLSFMSKIADLIGQNLICVQIDQS